MAGTNLRAVLVNRHKYLHVKCLSFFVSVVALGGVPVARNYILLWISHCGNEYDQSCWPGMKTG